MYLRAVMSATMTFVSFYSPLCWQSQASSLSVTAFMSVGLLSYPGGAVRGLYVRNFNHPFPPPPQLLLTSPTPQATKNL